jgi:hypothetical protein
MVISAVSSSMMPRFQSLQTRPDSPLLKFKKDTCEAMTAKRLQMVLELFPGLIIDMRITLPDWQR